MKIINIQIVKSNVADYQCIVRAVSVSKLVKGMSVKVGSLLVNVNDYFDVPYSYHAWNEKDGQIYDSIQAIEHSVKFFKPVKDWNVIKLNWIEKDFPNVENRFNKYKNYDAIYLEDYVPPVILTGSVIGTMPPGQRLELLKGAC